MTQHDLLQFNDSYEAEEALEKLTKRELHTLAEEIELIGHVKMNRKTLIRKVLFFGRILPLTIQYFRTMEFKHYTGVTQ